MADRRGVGVCHHRGAKRNDCGPSSVSRLVSAMDTLQPLLSPRTLRGLNMNASRMIRPMALTCRCRGGHKLFRCVSRWTVGDQLSRSSVCDPYELGGKPIPPEQVLSISDRLGVANRRTRATFMVVDRSRPFSQEICPCGSYSGTR